MKEKTAKSSLMEKEIQDLASYIEDLELQIASYKEQIVLLQAELPAQKELEAKEAKEAASTNHRQPSPKDPLEQDWQDLLEENKKDILKFIELKKLTRDIAQLEAETCFSSKEIEVLLATHEFLIPKVASCLLGIPFDVCIEWLLLAGGSQNILPGDEDL